MSKAVPSADVELISVVKRFEGFTAVNGIDLSIAPGTFVTLLGPSGCGKTTTLRMIGGFDEPTAGDVLIKGRPVERTPLKERQTRMVFQSYALFPHMTVAENVAYGLRMLKVPKSEISSKVSDVLALIGIPDKADSRPGDLSGGQQQRVALARALVTRPAVLLLDEPLGALDLKMRRRMQHELKQLQRNVGITFVYVTHDQEEAMALSDEIIVMENGQIAQRGTPDAIYRRPASAYVADFIGETNLIPVATGQLAVRPENVRLDVTGAQGLACRVQDIRFMGPFYRVFLKTPDGTEIRADLGKDPPPVGAEVVASWPNEEAVQLKS